MEQVFYAAIYQQGGTVVVMNDQKEPIPVPAIGAPIEVFNDGGIKLSGTVDNVSWDIKRQIYSPQFIVRRWEMRVTIV